MKFTFQALKSEQKVFILIGGKIYLMNFVGGRSLGV